MTSETGPTTSLGIVPGPSVRAHLFAAKSQGAMLSSSQFALAAAVADPEVSDSSSTIPIDSRLHDSANDTRHSGGACPSQLDSSNGIPAQGQTNATPGQHTQTTSSTLQPQQQQQQQQDQPQINDQPPVFSAEFPFSENSLPPPAVYPSRDAVFKAINQWALPRGYAFTTGRSHKEKSGKLTVTYSCDRHRPPRPEPTQRKRATPSRGTGCQFSVIAAQSHDRGTWTIRHRSGAQFATHNHEPRFEVSSHPVHRRLTEEDRAMIGRLAAAGIKPQQILTFMRQNSNPSVTQQDIYNRIAAHRRNEREG